MRPRPRRCKHRRSTFFIGPDDTIIVRCLKCRMPLDRPVKIWNGRGYGRHIYADEVGA